MHEIPGNTLSGKWKAIKVFKGLLIHSFKPSQTKHCETQLKSEYITKFKQKAPFTLYPACIVTTYKLLFSLIYQNTLIYSAISTFLMAQL